MRSAHVRVCARVLVAGGEVALVVANVDAVVLLLGNSACGPWLSIVNLPR